MDKYLADTTILVEHLRGSKIAFSFLKNNSPFISQVTIAELIEGTRNKKQLEVVDRVIADLPILPINENISTKSLELMKLFFHSHNLEYLDALIAVTVLENGLILVTDNIKHFSFIKDLSLISWQKMKAKIKEA